MPKRNNLRSKICPVCGKEYGITDISYPMKSLNGMFGYSEPNFYGGNVDKFSNAKCCREFVLYWKENPPSYSLVDIEPVDYEQMLKDIDEPIIEKAQEETVETVEAEVTEKADNVDGMTWAEIRKYAQTKGWEFDRKATRTDVMEWLKTNA